MDKGDFDPNTPEQRQARKRFGPTAVLSETRTGGIRVDCINTVYQFRNYFDFLGLDLCTADHVPAWRK